LRTGKLSLGKDPKLKRSMKPTKVFSRVGGRADRPGFREPKKSGKKTAPGGCSVQRGSAGIGEESSKAPVRHTAADSKKRQVIAK